ncbi:unnamed protein product [Parnassius apollo]|uniref:(apollo) hypothetical protein n=1 Tax=Parnassius apollo TaxID=110799 RepID=A0A8S3XZH6_PARAO|nr:unnamed protein product [Parnassius apollo]
MSKITFKINGKKYEVDGRYGPDFTLNEFIRTVADLRGTKSMCHEGGCGACVVAVRIPSQPTGELRTYSVNSCLVSILSCHGWEVITVEGIGNRTIGFHDIQTRLANFNGTQCGFCTPGWIMSMYSLYKSKNGNLSTEEIENSFAGNICRCTGYRSIADAFKTFASDADQDILKKLVDVEDLSKFKACGVKCPKICSYRNMTQCKKNKVKFHAETNTNGPWCILGNINTEALAVKNSAFKWFKVYTLNDIFKIIDQDKNDYKLIAGNTGQGVYHITDYPSNMIDIADVAEIKGYLLDVNLILGAGMSLSEMMEVYLKICSENEDFLYLKEFYDHLDLVAHIPVKNIGTIGGNLFMKYSNREFQSDIFLLLETVGAMITIASSTARKTIISLMEFLQTDMKGKIILNVLLPPISKYCLVKTFKIMPRSQNAHAIVNAGFMFNFEINSSIIKQVKIVYGGIAANFVHAQKTEEILVGKDLFTNETLQVALSTLSMELNPDESPPEPRAAFRKILATALYYKAVLYLCPENKLNPALKSGGKALKRIRSKGSQVFDTDKSVWPLNKPVPKLEALAQCSGEASFSNDFPKQVDEVFGSFVTADVNPGSILGDFDTTEAFKIPGVIAFYTAKDIPGENSFIPSNIPILSQNEEILCSKEVKFYGQPAGIIVADRQKTSNKAARLVKVNYVSINNNKPLLNIDDVLKSNEKEKRIKTDQIVEPTDKGNEVKSVLYGNINFETQYHYYFEPQTCVVTPTEDGLAVYSSTQWLDVTNVAVAQCLNIPVNSINVIVRRVGGSYGGKITRSSQIACAAAIVSHLLGKTCRFILSLMDNMKIIGKRIPTKCNFEVAINNEGVIQYLKNEFYQDNGFSWNDTITFLTLHHFRSCYDTSRWYIKANSLITDTPSNTWCRSPGSTEGIAMIEYIMEQISHHTGKDPIDIRLLNMIKENNPIPELIEQLKVDSNYEIRLADVKNFNKNNRWKKRAIKLMPMTYEIFYIGPYNAIVSIYHADGSVVIIHGGIEMGQGLNTKAAQVCAYILGIPLEKVSVKPSSSFTSPNVMTTGGSVGSECISFAVIKACKIILERLQPIKEKNKNASWNEIVQEAYLSGICLQASHTYSTSDPLAPYDIYGIVALELELDILTGNHDILRVDLLEDTGRSLSPEIDVGQIEGAFVMGLGYWTSEKIVYEPATGRILTDRTWTYKPPGLKDIPADFRIYFRRNSKNELGVLQSKGVFFIPIKF